MIVVQDLLGLRLLPNLEALGESSFCHCHQSERRQPGGQPNSLLAPLLPVVL